MSLPPWKASLDEAITHSDSGAPPFVLATADSSAGQPHARSIIQRDFFEPISPSRPLLLATTDIRSQKVFQATSAPLSEISWWFPSSQVQFRIAARVHIVPAPDHSSYQHFSPLFKKLAPSNFDWESERQTRFNRMSPYMRASWARPAPRTPIPSYDEGRKWPTELPKIGQGDNETEQKNIEFALSNFALLLLDPYEVDYVELGVQPNQRTIYTRTDDEDGSWSETIVVP